MARTRRTQEKDAISRIADSSEDALRRIVELPRRIVVQAMDDVEEGDDIEIKGNIVDHEYEFEVDGKKVAEVSKKWFRIRDTYGIQVGPDISPPLALAIAVALDAMTGHGD